MTVTVQCKPCKTRCKAVTDPHTGKDFVSTKAIKNLRVEGGDVAFDVELGYPAKSLIPSCAKPGGRCHTVAGVATCRSTSPPTSWPMPCSAACNCCLG
jgi:hypothetical protein